MKPLLFRGLLFLSALLCLTHCKPTAEPSTPPVPASKSESIKTTDNTETVTIGLSFDQRIQAYRHAQFEILHRLVKSRPKTLLRHANADGNAELQFQHIKQLTAEGVRFILVLPIDLKSLEPAIIEAEASGVQVLILAPPPSPNPSPFTFVYTKPQEIGEMAGVLISQALKQKQKSEGENAQLSYVVQIRGDEAHPSRQQAEGFRNTLLKSVGQVLVHDAPAAWDLEQVPLRLDEAIRIHPKFNVIYAHDDLLAAAAHRWIQESPHQLKRNEFLIVGTDGFPGEGAGQDLLQRGIVDYSIFHPPLVDYAWTLIQDQLTHPKTAMEGEFKLAPTLISPQNLSEVVNQGLLTPKLAE